jgi:hypothetical protein
VRRWFVNFQAALWKRKIIFTSPLHFFENSTNPKNCSESRIRISVPAFASLSLVNFLHHTWYSRLSEQFFRVTSGFRNSFLESLATTWRGLLEGFSESVRDFKKACRNFIFNFLHKMTAKYCKNRQRWCKSTNFDF